MSGITFHYKLNYSGDPKSDHSKSRLFEGQFSNTKMVRFSNCWDYTAFVIRTKVNHLKSGLVSYQNTVAQMAEWTIPTQLTQVQIYALGPMRLLLNVQSLLYTHGNK